MATSETTNQDTRQRLLDAAGEIFAEQGYRAATIRDICHRAGANIAAVNYHFGDKQKLYTEVLSYAYENARAKYPSDGGLAPDATAEQRLCAFIRALVFRIMDESRLAWHGKLMFRELMEPTEALGMVVAAGIRPEYERLRAIIAKMIGPDADEEKVLQCVWSVSGQCLFYYHAKPIINMLRPQGAYSQQDIEAIADHVTRFSLAALRCMTGETD